VESKESVLGDVLGLGTVAEDPGGNADHPRVFRPEQPVEGAVGRGGGRGGDGHAPDGLSIHIHKAPPRLIL
jgi:hypothetical protein